MRNSFCNCNRNKIKILGNKNKFQINSCNKCGHGFVSNSIDQKFLNDYYGSIREDTTFKEDFLKQDFPGSKSDALFYLKLFKKFNKNIQKFLEVGCGWGYASEYAFKKGWNISATEFSDNCVLSLKERTSSKSDIQKVSFEEFKPMNKNQLYDAILMSQVLEHSIEPIEWLLKANSMLAKKGVLIIAVPQFKGIYRLLGLRDPYICPPEHLNFFTKKSLRIALEISGFKVLYHRGFSRIPFYNIWGRRIKNKFIAWIIYKLLKPFFFISDLSGNSMIQYVVCRKKE